MDPVSAQMIIYHGMLAFFGAIVHAARAHRLGTSKTVVDFVMLVLMASFSGVIFALFGFWMFSSSQPYITLAIAGTGGFLGVEGMTIIIDQIRTLLSRGVTK